MNLFELEISELLILLLKIIVLLLCFTVIATMPFVPKVVKTMINKWAAKNSHVPSVQYLPENIQHQEKSTTEDDQENSQSTTFEEDLQKARDEKKRLYTTYSIDKLRLMAKDFGKTTGFKINRYYKLDKPSLIEALIQAEEMISIEKASEEAADIDVPDEIDND